jgi:hypothetical protein
MTPIELLEKSAKIAILTGIDSARSVLLEAEYQSRITPCSVNEILENWLSLADARVIPLPLIALSNLDKNKETL